MHRQAPDIVDVFERRSAAVGARLQILSEQSVAEWQTDLPGFVLHNWQLAYAAFGFVQKRDDLPEITEEKLQATAHVQVPGRMDIHTVQGKTLIMDGAHNGQKMQAFVAGFKQKYPGQKAAVLLSLKAGKDHQEVLPLLAPITSELIVTGFDLKQDTVLHATDPSELAEEARAFMSNVTTIDDYNEAYHTLLHAGSDILVVTGSFYLIGELRKHHEELRHARN
nr:Mur ligase family, glutamate ligase domain protein [uncultured bacterium]